MHAEVMITAEPLRPSDADKFLLLKLECFASSPIWKDGELVLEAEHNTSDFLGVKKSQVELVSMTKPPNDARQFVSYLRLSSNATYKLVIRRTDHLYQDGDTQALMTLLFK